jgi:antitoxin VapB
MEEESAIMGIKQMALNIKNTEVDELARELARLKHSSITDVILEALRESLARESARSRGRSLKDDLREIGLRCAALPDLDTRSPDEIIGYDEIGVPR